MKTSLLEFAEMARKSVEETVKRKVETLSANNNDRGH